MPTLIEITTSNFFGQQANITFYPCSGGTINLGTQILPYQYWTPDDNYLGTYDLVFSALSATCSFDIACP
jgi:hypothetical protein